MEAGFRKSSSTKAGLHQPRWSNSSVGSILPDLLHESAAAVGAIMYFFEFKSTPRESIALKRHRTASTERSQLILRQCDLIKRVYYVRQVLKCIQKLIQCHPMRLTGNSSQSFSQAYEASFAVGQSGRKGTSILKTCGVYSFRVREQCVLTTELRQKLLRCGVLVLIS